MAAGIVGYGVERVTDPVGDQLGGISGPILPFSPTCTTCCLFDGAFGGLDLAATRLEGVSVGTHFHEQPVVKGIEHGIFEDCAGLNNFDLAIKGEATMLEEVGQVTYKSNEDFDKGTNVTEGDRTFEVFKVDGRNLETEDQPLSEAET